MSRANYLETATDANSFLRRSRYVRGEFYSAVDCIKLYQQVSCINIDHKYLATQTFKPRELENFVKSGRCAFRWADGDSMPEPSE